MAERPDAYFRKNPGDVIRSSEWNELQVKAREEIRAHRHTGNEDGKQIARAGIEAGAIDGKLIDPAAEVSVMALTTSGNLTVKGDLKVNGKALLGDIADLLATVKGLQDDKLNRRGDTVSGTLRVQKNLQVDGDVGIGTTAPTHRLHVVALDAVGLFESSGETAVLRLSTKEGLDNRVEIANRPGGRLALWNNGFDVFNIIKNGNVGIGTTTPGQKLVVQADANTTGRDPDSGLSYGGQLAIKGNAPQLDFIDTDHNDWAIRVDGSKMYFIREPWTDTTFMLAANGNVGIGTDSPLQQLTITGGLGFANQYAGDKKLYSPKDGLLEWMTHDAAGEHGLAVSHQGQSRVYLNINGNSYLNGGNVGIGTIAPTHRLHVVALDAVGLFESSGEMAVLRLSTKEGLDNRVEIANRPGGRLSLWNNGKDVFNITRNGNVGIGTTTPGQKLIVQGDHNAGRDPDSGMSYGGQLAIKGNAPQIDFIDTEHNDWAIHVNEGRMYFVRQPWNANELVLDANGNVGIGTQAPSQKLEVNGNLNVTGRINGKLEYLVSDDNRWRLIMQGDRNLVVYGPSNEVVWHINKALSDLELKKELIPIKNATARLMSLRGVSFAWKDEEMGMGRELGIIAQEVESVFPELVSTLTGRKFVSYQGLIPVLIEAIKEQQAQITELRNSGRTQPS
jgi:hypothetical protein